MIKAFSIATAAFLFAATGAMAAEPDAADAKQEKRICKTEKMTGSLTRVRRTCLTQSEWARLAEGNKRNIDAITRDANQTFIESTRSPGPSTGAP